MSTEEEKKEKDVTKEKPAEAPVEEKVTETKEEAPAEEKTAEAPVEEKAKEKPVEEKPAEAPAEAPAEEKDEAKEENPKGNARQPKTTKPPKPTECAACAKALQKRLWYYRNGAFYCTKKCYKRKVEELRKEAESKPE